MKLSSCVRFLLSLACVSPAFATVVVTSPSNNTMVNPEVKFSASATTTTCKKGVAAMGVYVDDRLVYVANGTTLDKSLTLANGKRKTVVEEWDYCGGATTQLLNLVVNNNAAVSITSPANNAKVPETTLFSATATSACPKGVSSMGVYLNSKLLYKAAGSALSVQLKLPVGTQKAYVQEWDFCGDATNTPVTLNVASTAVTPPPVVTPPVTPPVVAPPVTPPVVTPPVTPPVTTPSGAVKLANIQSYGSWNEWGEYPPVYDICDAPCAGISWNMDRHHTDISLSGDSTKFTMGGTHAYSDVLWSNKLIGVGSTLGQFDKKHELLPTVHNMTFDADIYPTNMSVTQDIELDVNIYMNGDGMEWGTQCNNLAGKVWDYWDNVAKHWRHTAIPCDLKDNTWNHVTFTTHRNNNNDLVYETLTQNGVTYNMNITVPPFKVPTSWYGMTLNYQLDGNRAMTTNTTYVDNMSVTYW